MMKYLKQNKLLASSVLGLLALFMMDFTKGELAVSNALNNIQSVGMILPPIFILIGLLDVWVPKEIMVKYMGEKSGFLGGFLAVLLGAVGAGPLVVAFPIAGLLIKKGARLANVFLFLGAWTSVKLPIFMFEWHNFGGRFTLTHVLTSMSVYMVSGIVIERLLSSQDKTIMVEKANEVA